MRMNVSMNVLAERFTFAESRTTQKCMEQGLTTWDKSYIIITEHEVWQ